MDTLMGIEEIHKTYQFTHGDTYLLADVDFFKKEITIRVPWRRRWFMRTDVEWIGLKQKAINHLVKQYGFDKITTK